MSYLRRKFLWLMVLEVCSPHCLVGLALGEGFLACGVLRQESITCHKEGQNRGRIMWLVRKQRMGPTWAFMVNPLWKTAL